MVGDPVAVSIASVRPPDVILCDIGRSADRNFGPGEALLATRSEITATLIAVSDLPDPNQRDRALVAGFAAYVTKPLRIEELRRLIRNT